MNDVYVGLFIVAAYTLFAPLWIGPLAEPLGVLGWSCPIVGARCSGSPSPRSGSRSYAIGGIVLLILAASALGPVVLDRRADRGDDRARLHGDQRPGRRDDRGPNLTLPR